MDDYKKIEEKIRIFDLIEINLNKIEYIWKKLSKYLEGKSDTEEYEILVNKYYELINTLPKIENWCPHPELLELSEIKKLLIDNDMIGDYEFSIDMYKRLFQPEREITHYNYLLKKRRNESIRKYIKLYLLEVENEISRIVKKYETFEIQKSISEEDLVKIKECSKNIEFLLGKQKLPNRWNDFQRHLHFHVKQDILDIKKNDLPEIKIGLDEILYQKEEPIKIDIDSLDDMVTEEEPSELVIKSLKWKNITEEDFERIIYNLISTTPNYENAKWLTKTRAADKGRDLSVEKILHDGLR